MGYKDYNDYELLDAYLENDDVAEKILMDKYMPLIFLVATEYKQYLLQKLITEFTLDDLILIGKEALLTAARKYDERSGVLFYTYFLCCLKSKLNTFCRGLSAKKNKPLFHYQSLDYEVEDFCAVTPYLDDNPERFCMYFQMEEVLKDYLFHLSFEQQSVLELRFNGFAYKEIESLLEVSKTFIVQVLCKAKHELNKIIN